MANERRLRRVIGTALLGIAASLVQSWVVAQPAQLPQVETSQSVDLNSECPKPSIGLTDVAQRVAPDHLLQSGAAGNALVRQAVDSLCEELDASRSLPNSCNGSLPNNALIALRDRLILDLAAQVGLLEGQVATPELRTQLRVVAAIVEMVLSERSQASFAFGLSRTYAEVSAKARLCGLAAELPLDAPPMPAATEPLVRAARLLMQLQRVRVDDRGIYRGMATQFLGQLETGLPVEALTPEQESTLTELVQQSRQLRAVEARLLSAVHDEAAIRELVVGNLRSLALGLSLIKAPPIQLPDSELVGLALALAAGDLKQVLSQVAALARAEVPVATLRRVERLVALLRAESDDERKRIIRREILGFEPWPEDLLVNAHVGALMLNGATYKIAGDLLLGYNGKSWGVALRGHINAYELSNAAKIDMTERYAGSLETWLTVNPARGLGLEGRLVLGGVYNDTTVTSGRDMLSEESILGRASLLAGLRYQRSRVAMGVWLGGGLQFDRYEPTALLESNRTVADTTSDTIQGHATTRLRLQYQLLPDILAIRIAANGEYFHLTRATVTTTMGGSMLVDDSTTSAKHVDAYGRLYIDAEVARFFDFVPGIAGGFDLTYEKGSEGPQTMLAPVVTAGIRRTSF